MAKFLLSCRPGSYGKYSLYAIEHLAELGVKYIELDAPKSKEDAEVKKEMLDDFNMKALSVAYPIDIDDKKVVEKFKNALEWIKILEPMYLFSSVKVKKEKERSKGYPILKELGDIANENNLFISVETHPPYNTNGDRGKETMENVNSPGVKINFDTSNIYYYNKNIKIEDELMKVLPWLGSMHIKDSKKRYHDWYFPAIGDGEVDFPKVLAIVNQLEQKVPLTIEIEGIKGEKLDLDQTKERVKKSVEYLRSLGYNLE
ncbi:MAG: sugar phosphate isomerase/epimerase family protein [Promethearchaeota archaeon]